MGDRLTLERSEARNRLAEHLFGAMERLDPSQETIPWESLGEEERDFYRACIRILESEQGLWSLLFRQAAC